MKGIKIRSLCVISINVIGVIGLIYFAIPFLVHDTRIVNPNAMLPAEAWDWAGMILTFGLVPLLIANGFGFFFVRGKRKTVRFYFYSKCGVPGDRVSLLDSGDGYGVRIMVILLILFLLVIIVCLLYRTMDKAYERQIAAYQNKLLKNQVDEVHNLYLTMRGWRHDYHNHMQSVKAYLAMDSLDEARAYLDRLEQDLDDIDLLFHTGNINADAILNSKISLAVKRGIQVDYKATVPRELAVSDIDLCVVIGNLIDNAVEACEG